VKSATAEAQKCGAVGKYLLADAHYHHQALTHIAGSRRSTQIPFGFVASWYA
jgi:hypothetical protein